MATLTFRYEAREARLTALAVDGGPETYDLCTDHAERTRPPHGWTLQDERPVEAPEELPDADELRSSHTVAVLAAALRGDPDTDADTEADEDGEAATTSADAQALDLPEERDEAVPATEEAPSRDEDEVAAQVDVDALDAIVDQPFDDVARDADLFASADEADPRPDPGPAASSDALSELSALSEHPDPPPPPPGRTVPGARRPD